MLAFALISRPGKNHEDGKHKGATAISQSEPQPSTDGNSNKTKEDIIGVDEEIIKADKLLQQVLRVRGEVNDSVSVSTSIVISVNCCTHLILPDLVC